MWEQSLIESKKNQTRKRKWMGWPLSIAFHAGLLLAICFASFWNIAAVEPVDPTPPLVYQTFVVPAAPPVLGNQSAIRKNVNQPVKTSFPANPVVVPEQNSELPPADNTKTYDNSSTINNDGVPGVPWGVDGGNPNSTSEGVPGGIPSIEEPPAVLRPGMEAPVLIQRIEPPYPKLALITRKKGIVILQAIITKTGTVEEITVLRSADPLLDQAAMQAVKQWIYRPATLNGRPIKVFFTVTVKFHLR
jgi:periplasmic protein TonB